MKTILKLDHIAYRCIDRYKAAEFFIDNLNYKIVDEFPVDLGEGQKANCLVLRCIDLSEPEIFISDGEPGSLIYDWVVQRIKQNHGMIHHIAYRVGSVDEVMEEWKHRGVSFASEAPFTCPEDKLRQIFTKPHPLTGIVYELIERGEHGFCRENVSKLMISSK